MKIDSLDPRINRANLDSNSKEGELDRMDHFQTYEVFEQKKRGTHHMHVGSVHAPSSELAMMFAKEQYSRRGQCVNLWVVKTSDILATQYEDADIFETTASKHHRDPNSYKVMDRIKAFKERQKAKHIMEFNDKHVMGLKDLLYRMADDLLILGHRNSEWTGLGPILEEDIAFSSMAQDKIGQSLALYEILQELGESDPDTVAFTRNAEQFHSCHLVEMPIGEYDFSLVRHFFFDHQSALRMEMLVDTVVEPLQMVARKFKGEIKYHTMHADTWLKQLAATEESRLRIQTAINESFSMALGMFESSDYEKELIEANIFGGEDELKAKWYDMISEKLTAFGYTVPSLDSEASNGGRKGEHTKYLQPLLDEMTEVFSIDPAADW